MRGLTTAVLLPIAFGFMLTTAPLGAQGKGNDKERGSADSRGQGQDKDKVGKGDDKGQADQAKGKSNADRASKGASDFGRARAAEVREMGGRVAGPARPMRGSDRYMREFRVDDVRPIVRGFAVSDRMSERIAGRAVAIAFDRGVGDDALIVRPVDHRVRVLNQAGLVLLELDDVRARNLGAWRVVSLRDRDDDREGSPAFCRSGAGHPVWGRQWCIDKRFGLGADSDIRWGRAIELENVVLGPRSQTGDLTRDVLLGVLGDGVFNRLAAHAITLGLVDPLAGRWAVESTGRRVLIVNAGTAPVAEFVDSDADGRADVLFVALRPW
ncbi:MAG: hypothetical protein WD801_12470 [Gemmatimonadaceae bacterium]